MVLIADDHIIARNILKRLLEKADNIEIAFVLSRAPCFISQSTIKANLPRLYTLRLGSNRVQLPMEVSSGARGILYVAQEQPILASCSLSDMQGNGTQNKVLPE